MRSINCKTVSNIDILKEITFHCFSYAYFNGFISSAKYHKLNGFMRNECHRVNQYWIESL